MLIDEIGELEERSSTLTGRAVTTPSGVEGGTGGRDGEIDIARRSGRDETDRFASRRIDRLERLTVDRRNEFVVDKESGWEGVRLARRRSDGEGVRDGHLAV